jgi:DNA-binding transcriptional LysR family regulator
MRHLLVQQGHLLRQQGQLLLLFKESLVAAFSPDHAFARARRLRWQDLKGQPVLTLQHKRLLRTCKRSLVRFESEAPYSRGPMSGAALISEPGSWW